MKLYPAELVAYKNMAMSCRNEYSHYMNVLECSRAAFMHGNSKIEVLRQLF